MTNAPDVYSERRRRTLQVVPLVTSVLVGVGAWLLSTREGDTRAARAREKSENLRYVINVNRFLTGCSQKRCPLTCVI